MLSTPPYLLPSGLADFVARTEALTAGAGGLAAQRAAYARMCQAFTPARPAGVLADENVLQHGGQVVRVRRYRPGASAPADAVDGWPCVLFLHGGGWVVGGLDSHDFLTAALCAELQAVVVAVDYRLAPEHPFPAAVEDAHTAWHALQTVAPAWGLDPRRVAIAGDSAGGNIAAGLCLALADGAVPPCGLALVYPALADVQTHGPLLPSYQQHAHAPMLAAADMAYLQNLYLPDAAMRRDPRAVPLLAASLSGLPPTLVAVAEYDPLCDEGLAFARRLQAAGVPAELHIGLGLVHGCLRARGLCAEVDTLHAVLVGALRRFLAVPG